MEVTDKAAFLSILFNEEIYVVNDPAIIKEPFEEPATAVFNEPLHSHPQIQLNNNKIADLLLLFNYPGATEVPEADEILITNALKAANIDFKKNTCWLNTSLYPELHWTDIEAAGPATKIIAFGIKPKLLPVLLTEGELAEENGKQILNVASIAEMHDNDERKRLLWRGMKRMLNF